MNQVVAGCLATRSRVSGLIDKPARWLQVTSATSSRVQGLIDEPGGCRLPGYMEQSIRFNIFSQVVAGYLGFMEQSTRFNR